MNSDIHVEKVSVQLSSFPALSLMDELQRKSFFAEKKKADVSIGPLSFLNLLDIDKSKVTQY